MVSEGCLGMDEDLLKKALDICCDEVFRLTREIDAIESRLEKAIAEHKRVMDKKEGKIVDLSNKIAHLIKENVELKCKNPNKEDLEQFCRDRIAEINKGLGVWEGKIVND